MTKGKVYLVGAGPGNPELITVRGLDLIRTADVILYDSLVNNALLADARKDALLIYSGKRGYEDSIAQSDTNQKVLKFAREGKNIVRLKGGDPYLFSRGGEEVEMLALNNIPFEIVPGITSPIAAAAYAGIPISHRDYSSSVAIATGTPRSGKTLSDLKVPDADSITYVMCVKNLPEIVQRLIEAGKPPETPAALVQNATLGSQRTVISSLRDIQEVARKENIEAPAVFIVGEVAGLSKRFKWFEKMPLYGKKLVVTRSGNQARDTITKLSRLGAYVIYHPTIDIREIAESRSKLTPDYIGKFTDIIFTSENGVRIFFDAILDNGTDARQLAEKKIYAIGPATSDMIKQYGIIADKMPDEYTSKGIVDILDNDLKGRRFLLPRAMEASSIIDDALTNRGAVPEKIALYKIEKPEKTDAKLPEIDGVLFMSSKTAENFLEMYGWPKGAVAFCIGERTAEILKGHNIKTVIPNSATEDELIKTILEYYL